MNAKTPQETEQDTKTTLQWTSILDVTAKLIGACAVVFATFVANNYQSSMTATNLLVQREQADSALRAGMFHDLIGPIIGSGNAKGDIAVDRERLLVELLALNFHDHFALKPLMMHVDERLAHEENIGMTQPQREDARESLRSASRRVAQQQLSMLTKAESAATPEQQACIYYLQLDLRNPTSNHREILPIKSCSSIERYFNDLLSITSPNGLYTLSFTVAPPKSWDDQNFEVSMSISRKAPAENTVAQLISAEQSKKENTDYKDTRHIADQDFLLTWFDFPLSDNTLLADGTRFALVIDQVDKESQMVNFKLIWFPQDYFAAQERPTNYRQFREKLGLKLTQ